MLKCLWDLQRYSAGLLAVLGLLILAPGVAAQSDGKQGKAAKTELSAGLIRAKLLNAQDGTTYAAGDRAFVELRVRSSGRRRRGVRSATFEFVADGGVIRAISGRYVRTRRDGDVYVAEVRKLRRNQDRVLLVEVDMTRPPDATAEKVQNTLRVTLRAPKVASPPSVTLVWQVAMCAAGYHKALSGLRQGQVDTLLPALRSVRKKDVALPGRWLFWKQTRRSRRSRRTCLRWKRYRRTRGDRVRIIRRCTRWARKRLAKTSPVQIDPSAPSKEELALKRFIGAFVVDRGAAPELARDGKFGWVTQRLTYDLRTFTGQPPHPALCSGTPNMLAYFARRAEDLGRRQKAVATVQAGTTDLLATRIKAAYEIRKAHKIEIPQAPAATPPDASGARGKSDVKPARPGKVAVGADAAKPIAPAVLPIVLAMPAGPTSEVQLDRQVIYLAGLVLPVEALGALRDETDPIAALKMARTLLRSDTIKHVPASVMQATLAAFRMLETAAYIERLQQRYDLLVRPLFASLSAIKTSHAKSCTCGQ